MDQISNSSILIVDDEPIVRSILRHMLEKKYNINEAKNGLEAILSVQSNLPDLVILDINLPDINGYEVCSRLKNIEKVQHIPVIFLSSLDETESIVRGFEVGGLDYITKPFNVQEVLARVKTHIQLKQLQEKLNDKLIAEKINAEEERKTQYNFLMNAINALDHPFYIIDANDYTIQLANEKTGKFLKGKSTCYQSTHKQEVPCNGLEHTCTMELIKQKNHSVILEHIHYDEKGKERFVEVHGHPIFNKDGKIQQIIEYSIDITERRRTEFQLIETSEHLKMIFNTISDSILITRLDDGLIIDCNDGFSKMSGYSRDEVIGKTTNEINLRKDPNGRQKTIEELNKNGFLNNYESIYRCKDGSMFTGISSAQMINYKGTQGLLVVTRDISDRKKAELIIEKQNKELEELNSYKDKLISIIAHDLKNPFSSILGLCELLKELTGKYNDEKILKSIDLIEGSAKLAFNLLENLLEWSKLQRNLVVPHIQKNNIKVIVFDILYMFKDRIETKKIKIENQINTDLFIQCDLEMTKVVFRNILSNAIKYSKNEGNVFISNMESDSDVIIKIQDNGVGISENNIPYIFNKEKYTISNGTHKERGTGLGLLLCKEIIDRQGGKIWVESVVGRGRYFLFYFKKIINMNQNNYETILIIDDDVLFCDMMQMALEFNYSSIITINDGKEALNHLLNLESIPKVIFLDYHLPEFTGVEIFSKLRESNKELPIIFLTSMQDISTAVEVIQKGALDYIEKGKVKLQELPLIIEKNSIAFQDRIQKKILEQKLIQELEQRKIIQTELELVNSDLKIEHGILLNTIQELKSAQLQLVQSEKMASLGILMAGVAHEINNPINYISSSISGLENIFEELNKYKEKILPIANVSGEDFDQENINKLFGMIEKMLTNIKTGVSRTIQIINSLKNFSRSDENVLRLTDINESIENTLIILHHQYKNRIVINKSYGNISSINCFPGKINQVIMNILANAIQSIEQEGIITITTSNFSNDKISISIRDTGCGISEKIIPNIFDPFFTTKEPGHGTGLGLSIAYDIVKQHNGQIAVKSELKEGTEFIVILPI